MAIDLSALPEEVAVPESFVVERVRGEARLGEWVATFGMGHGVGPADVRWFEGVLRRIWVEGA